MKTFAQLPIRVGYREQCESITVNPKLVQSPIFYKHQAKKELLSNFLRFGNSFFDPKINL